MGCSTTGACSTGSGRLGLNGGWVLVDREVHLFHGARGHQFVTETAGGGPDEQVGGCAGLQRLDENLVFAPFDLERRTAGGDLRDGLAEFDHAEMVLRRTQPRNLIPVRLLCLDLLAECGQSRDCDKHQSAFHGLYSFSQCLYLSEKPTGRPGFPDLPESHTTCRPASASEPWASAWNQEVRASRPSLPPARTRTPRDESAEFGRDRRSGRRSSLLA